MSLFLTVKENEGGNSAHSTREEEKYTELTDHIGDERLSRLGMPGQGDTLVGNVVEAKIGKYKHHQPYQNKTQGKV